MSPVTATLGLDRLNRELSDRDVRCEVCTAGGAVLSLVFSAAPPTRNVRALFQPQRLLDEAVEQVRADLALEENWLTEAVRARLGPPGVPDVVELSNLLIFEAPLEYLLAMKCAALAASRRPEDRDDIRLLLRLLYLSSSDAALEVVQRYFNERQLPADLASLVDGLLSG